MDNLHSNEPNKPMNPVQTMQFVAGKGIAGNPRYFDAITKRGKPNTRHVSLIENEIIEIHKYTLNTNTITRANVRSNVVTSGINLLNLVGRDVKIGNTAVVRFSYKIDPCYKMDNIQKGLMKQMMNGKQGVIAEIIVSGEIKIGDVIRPIN
jgi:MOSC domain-containing protein YiiM